MRPLPVMNDYYYRARDAEAELDVLKREIMRLHREIELLEAEIELFRNRMGEKK